MGKDRGGQGAFRPGGSGHPGRDQGRLSSFLQRYHPDLAGESAANRAKIQQGTEAYQALLAFCEAYEFPLVIDESDLEPDDEDWWMDRFGQDPLWGPARDKAEKRGDAPARLSAGAGDQGGLLPGSNRGSHEKVVVAAGPSVANKAFCRAVVSCYSMSLGLVVMSLVAIMWSSQLSMVAICFSWSSEAVKLSLALPFVGGLSCLSTKR